jgi:hypothetical protein
VTKRRKNYPLINNPLRRVRRVLPRTVHPAASGRHICGTRRGLHEFPEAHFVPTPPPTGALPQSERGLDRLGQPGQPRSESQGLNSHPARVEAAAAKRERRRYRNIRTAWAQVAS